MRGVAAAGGQLRREGTTAAPPGAPKLPRHAAAGANEEAARGEPMLGQSRAGCGPGGQ